MIKVTNSQGKVLSVEQVAELPMNEDAKAAKVRHMYANDGICYQSHTVPGEVCRAKRESAPRGQPELATTAAEFTVGAGSTPSRPSLEVETEVHSNLAPRIHAHIGRMRAWDLRKLPAAQATQVKGALDDLSEAYARLSLILAQLTADGFVAKTTPVTRIAAKLEKGAKVHLREDQLEVFSKVYSPEQLASLSVVRTTDTHVQLMADDGSNFGLVRIIHVTVKP
jgi:hypothetical protein